MDIADGLRVFVAAAQTGSFTGAAQRLGISAKLASKYLGELEADMGTRLFHRTTRRMALTGAGERLLLRAPGWLNELEEMMGEARDEARGLAGTIRVTAPVTFGESAVQGMLARFAHEHPDLTVDLRLTDSFVDLASGGIDLAIRIGQPGGNALIARRLGDMSFRVVASPDYIAAHGRPDEPEDLAAHLCIRDTNLRGLGWPFYRGGRELAVRVSGRFLVNSARATRGLVLAGEGIGLCPDFIVAEDLAAGRLVELLASVERPSNPINAVYLEGPHTPRKTRALIDFLVAEMRARGTAEDVTTL